MTAVRMGVRAVPASAFSTFVLGMLLFGMANGYCQARPSEMTQPNTGRKTLQVNVNANVDLNKLIDQIASASNQPDSDSFVQDVVNKAANTAQGYNVLMCNLAGNCRPALSGGPNNGGPFYTSQQYNSVLFGIWIFQHGTLDHCGSDGGFINWGFTGGQRSGDGGCHVEW